MRVELAAARERQQRARPRARACAGLVKRSMSAPARAACGAQRSTGASRTSESESVIATPSKPSARRRRYVRRLERGAVARAVERVADHHARTPARIAARNGAMSLRAHVRVDVRPLVGRVRRRCRAPGSA